MRPFKRECGLFCLLLWLLLPQDSQPKEEYLHVGQDPQAFSRSLENLKDENTEILSTSFASRRLFLSQGNLPKNQKDMIELNFFDSLSRTTSLLGFLWFSWCFFSFFPFLWDQTTGHWTPSPRKVQRTTEESCEPLRVMIARIQQADGSLPRFGTTKNRRKTNGVVVQCVVPFCSSWPVFWFFLFEKEEFFLLAYFFSKNRSLRDSSSHFRSSRRSLRSSGPAMRCLAEKSVQIIGSWMFFFQKAPAR